MPRTWSNTPNHLAEASFMSIEGGDSPHIVHVELSPDRKRRLSTKSATAGQKRQRVMEHAQSMMKMASDLKARLAKASPVKPARSLDEELFNEAVRQADAELGLLERTWSEAPTRSSKGFYEYRDALLALAERCKVPDVCVRARALAEAAEKAARVLDVQSAAEYAKLRGNDYYLAAQYAKAEERYHEAATLDPRNAVFAGNRAAALLMLGRFPEALQECERAIRLDGTYVRAYLRSARASLSLGDAAAALSRLESVAELAGAHCAQAEEARKVDQEAADMVRQAHEYVRLVQQADAALAAEDFLRAETSVAQAVHIAPAATRVRAMQSAMRLVTVAAGGADAEACSAALQQAMSQVRDCTAGDLYRYGMILFRRALRSEAVAFLQLALHKDPRDAKAAHAVQTVREIDAKLREGAKLQAEGRFNDALGVLSAAVALDPSNDALNGRILYQRAGVSMLAGRLREAEEDCRRALLRLPTYQKARLRLARVLIAQAHTSEAAEQLDKAWAAGQLPGRLMAEYQQLRAMLPAASGNRSEARPGSAAPESMPPPPRPNRWGAQQPPGPRAGENHRPNAVPPPGSSVGKPGGDFYAVLGVPATATREEIRKAYKKGALLLHPDKNLGSKASEEDFKRLVEAFQVIGSPSKRRVYDLGGGRR